MIQSTQRVQESLSAVPTGTTTQPPVPDVSFRNLLENAVNTRAEPAKESAKSEKAMQPEGAAQPEPTQQPKKDKSKAKQTEQAEEPEQPSNPQRQEVAAAALLVPQLIVAEQSVEAVQPIAAAVQPQTVLQTQPVLIQTQPAVTVVQAPVVTVQPQAEPVPIVTQAVQETQPTVQVPLTEAAASQAPETQAAVVEANGMKHAGREASPLAQEKAADLTQERFDTLLVKASRQLTQGKAELQQQPQTEMPKPLQGTEAVPAAKAQALVKEAPKEQQGEQTQQPKAETAELMRQELPSVQIKGMEEVQAPKQLPQPTPTQQVETQLIRQMEEGKTEFRMQLTPETLGKVDVRMLLEDGKLTVQIVTATAKAAQELQRTGENLMASLRMAGTQLESVQIVHRTEQPSQQMDGAFHRENGQQQGNESRGNQGGQKQSRDAQWEEDIYDRDETPSRLLDQAV